MSHLGEPEESDVPAGAEDEGNGAATGDDVAKEGDDHKGLATHV